jgi:hypothetical protein
VIRPAKRGSVATQDAISGALDQSNFEDWKTRQEKPQAQDRDASCGIVDRFYDISTTYTSRQ